MNIFKKKSSLRRGTGGKKVVTPKAIYDRKVLAGISFGPEMNMKAHPQ